MPIKVCFENEIHRFSKLFPSLELFTAHMTSSFQTKLPQSWAPSYINSEGVNIVITSESDYQNLFENYSKDSNVTLRLYIVILNPNTNALEDKNIAKEEKLEQVQFVNDQNEVIPIVENNTQAVEVIDVQHIKHEQSVSNEDLASQHQREKTSETNEHAAFEQKQNEIKPQADPQPKKEEDRLDQLKKMVEKLILGKFPEDKVEIAKMKIQKLEATLTPEQKEELNKKREQVEKAINEKKAKQEKAAAKLLQKQAKAKMEVKKDAPSEPIQTKEETKQQEDLISEQKLQSTITPQPTEKKTIIKQMKCGGCNVSLTSGIAYKCSQCLDFNFCESCEATKEHPHLFLKIKDVGLFTENNAKAVKKTECPYAVFQKLMEDLKKGNLEQVQKCCSKYLTKLPEEARKTLISLFENIPEENKEKVKEALIQFKEKAFGKDNCSCVEERERLKEAQRLFKEEKTAFAKAQKESKLKLKEEWSALKTTKKAETEKLKAEWQKLKEKKKEDAEKLKEEQKKLKDNIASDKEKKKEAAPKSSVVKEKNQPKDEKKESALAENVEIEDLLI